MKTSKEEYDKAREKYKLTKTYEEMKEETKNYSHPDALNNFEATVIYIIVMIGSSIFSERILIWIVASFIYFNYIRR
ncbi:MAG: hypothetical protein IKV88_09210 [Clostridia bacterium]|nr:hypothetical protein [Clostridia bacterium]